MDKPIAIAMFALSLYGCGPESRSLVDRVRRGDVDVVHSAATVHAGRARFECLRSASGACHYSVHRPDCGQPPFARRLPRCAPLHRFTLAEHRTLEIDGLQHFTLCVSVDAQVSAPCRPVGQLFTRK